MNFQKNLQHIIKGRSGLLKSSKLGSTLYVRDFANKFQECQFMIYVSFPTLTVCLICFRLSFLSPFLRGWILRWNRDQRFRDLHKFVDFLEIGNLLVEINILQRSQVAVVSDFFICFGPSGNFGDQRLFLEVGWLQYSFGRQVQVERR